MLVDGAYYQGKIQIMRCANTQFLNVTPGDKFGGYIEKMDGLQ